MEIDPAALSHSRLYQFLISAVVPRPIAFVSTRSRDGHDNLAPFSFYMGVGSDPPMIAFSVSDRDGGPKDTARNLEETGEFVVHASSEELLAALNEASGDWTRDVDEFVRAGLAKAPSTRVAPPRVRDARVALECRVHTIVPLGRPPRGVRLVVGEVVWIHADDAVLEGAPDSPRVDPEKLRPLARLGRNLYTTLGRILALDRPRAPRPPGPGAGPGGGTDPAGG